ncbi:MAG TPA: SDR family NAD(P)-dependent oxidoreductase [Xanthobacteraceae bacterium]|nr:SDR family NAD(P)-dependent oxidoreductase [Xanthobacteraceae bacterium]
MKDFKGKTAYVSGAASGMGFGIASALAQAGANVAMIDIRADALKEARARLHNLGDRIETYVSDVSDAAVLEDTAREIDRRFGPIHIVCNNAGVSMHGMPLEQIPLADWDWLIDVNIKGVINGIKTFVPRMKAHGQESHIVNTASIGGLQVNPNFMTGAYSMTKYAVVALSEALDNELKDTNIGISVLCPAAVDTGIHLSARSRPERHGGPFERPQDHFMGELIKDGLRPEQVGQRVVKAIRNKELYILTHSTPREWVERRFNRVLAAFEQAEEFERELGIEPWRLNMNK